MVVRLVAVMAAGWVVAVLRRGGTGGIETGVRTPPTDASLALADLLADVAVGMLLVVGAWLVLAALVGVAASVPGLAGRLAGVAWAWLVPRAARAALATVLGIGATAAPAMGSTAPPAGDTGLVRAGADHLPQVARPATRGDWSDGALTSASPVARARGERSPSARPGQTVTVRPGDSLWLIAERSLGPGSSDASVAEEWPRWYALNRTTIGPDPDLLVTGTVLTVHEASGGLR